MSGEERAYPLPERDDLRFTFGLLVDVAQVLTRHGYPQPGGRDYVELQLALYRFLYVGGDR